MRDSGRHPVTSQQFSPIAQRTDHLLCAFWTAGFTARPPDIGSARCILIFQVSNRTIRCILKRSARLYGECMEPDHMAKYSSPMLTDWTENLIQKKTFYVLTPSQFWRCFWTRLGILRSTMWFFSRKSKYWQNYKGGKFCWISTEATIHVTKILQHRSYSSVPGTHSSTTMSTKFRSVHTKFYHYAVSNV